MTNNFDALATSNASEKIYLVKIKVDRSIMGDLIPVVPPVANTYQCTLPVFENNGDTLLKDKIASIKADDVTLSESTSPLSSGEYEYQPTGNPSDTILKVCLPDSLATYQANGDIILSYYLFFTNNRNRYAAVYPNDQEVIISSGTTQWLDFNEGGPEISVSLPVGYYKDKETFAQALQDAVNLAATANITITYLGFENFFKIETDGTTLNLLFSTGTHQPGLFYALGFGLDQTGSTSYISDNDDWRYNSYRRNILYENRLLNNPVFTISQEDLIDRVLSISNTSVQIDNTDNFISTHLVDASSFNKNEVSIWRCLDSIDNIQFAYLGYCTDVQVGRVVTFSIDSSLTVLNDLYYPNSDDLVNRFNTTAYPYLNLEYNGVPITKMFCPVSKTHTVINKCPLTAPLVLQPFHSIAEGHKLVNVSYNPDVAGYNLDWVACYASDTSSELSESVVVQSSYDGTGAEAPFRYAIITVADKNRYRPGDYLYYTNGSGEFLNGFVRCIDTNSVSQTITLGIRIASPPGGEVISTVTSIRRIAIPQITVKDGENYYNLNYITDYNFTTNVNGHYQVTFSSSVLSGNVKADSEIYYRCYNHDNLNHGTVLSQIIEAATDLFVDDASVTTANSTSFITNFSVPFFGSTEFPKIRDIVERLLISTFGYLTIDSHNLLQYKLIQSLSPTLTITDNEIIKDSIKQEIKYSDICNDITLTNNHGEYIASLAAQSSMSGSIKDTRKFIVSTNIGDYYLFKQKNAKQIEIAVVNPANSQNIIASVITKRRNTIEFKTKGINFLSLLGDDITINSSYLVGNSTTNIYKIMSITQTADETTIRAIDLYGI